MSKKIAKLLGGLAAVGAAAAGIFYLYKKNSESDFVDEFADDFDADEFELDEDLKDTSDRGYTTLNPAPEAEECTCGCCHEEAPAEECSCGCCHEEAPVEECSCGCCHEEAPVEECNCGCCCGEKTE